MVKPMVRGIGKGNGLHYWQRLIGDVQVLLISQS